MVLEREILPLLDWLLPSLHDMGALLVFALVVAGLIVVSIFVAYLRMAVLLGPSEGFYAVAKAIGRAVSDDFPNTSLRRILAIARLAVQESWRRRILVAFVIFAVILLFAGWFLDPESDHPARLYLSFVLTATEMLFIIMAVLLSTFSLPNDIKNKTIHTVITKPVRAGEIVVGRILGFCVIGTVLLAVMCVFSYGFVRRGLSHQHTVLAEDVEKIADEEGGGWKGETIIPETALRRETLHRHQFTVAANGVGRTDTKKDHYHVVERVGEGEDATYKVGPPQGALVARVPRYGKLRFIDIKGGEGKGISVGKEWQYRRYIEGGSLAAGVWTFDGIELADFVPSGLSREERDVALTAPDQRTPEQQKLADERDIDARVAIPLEMTLSVFRTYKGDIVSGVLGGITIKNPKTGLRSEEIQFTASEFVTDSHSIPRKLKIVRADGTVDDGDLFRDLVDENGRVEIWIQCLEHSQYFGMAAADLYIRAKEGFFFWNFIKAHISIWLQMVIVICFGVTLSTFLSAPVALFSTFVVYITGLFREFIMNVATGEQVGGGPIESTIRMATQKNVSIDLDINPVVDWLVVAIDKVLMALMWMAARVLPDFRSFNTSRFVSDGFNIDGNLMAEQCLTAAAFVLVLSVFGYFFLKSREVAG